ncbi:hypothetical protein C8F04DRAFT_1159279, partial [Mycena alexandri]
MPRWAGGVVLIRVWRGGSGAPRERALVLVRAGRDKGVVLRASRRPRGHVELSRRQARLLIRGSGLGRTKSPGRE